MLIIYNAVVNDRFFPSLLRRGAAPRRGEVFGLAGGCGALLRYRCTLRNARVWTSVPLSGPVIVYRAPTLSRFHRH